MFYRGKFEGSKISKQNSNCLINRNKIGCFVNENIFYPKARSSLLPSCVRHFVSRKEAPLYHYLKEKKVPGQNK